MQVLPGSLLQVSGDFELGPGLYRLNGCIYSSRVGTISTTALQDGKQLIQVVSPRGANYTLLPTIGQTILGTVTRLTTRYVGIDISVLDTVPPVYLEEPFKGTLRSQDIWPPEDKEAPQQMNLAFRPGDLVRARIIGMGDASAGFLLSTAVEDSLGVVFARCAASDEPLVPISWNEMICSKTGIKENRKPAKPMCTNADQ
jgi:exosome complex component CSL4